MPLLARMVASPLFIDIRPGAVESLPDVLRHRHISAEGQVLVAVGKGQGREIWGLLAPAMPKAEVFTVTSASLSAANELEAALKGGSYDAVVAIGGGRTLDVAKYAATRSAIPMVAVATNLAHDGICSPVSSLETAGGKGSFGVAMPLAVVVDLDFVHRAPSEMVRSGVGDVISNLSAISDWVLAHEVRDEPVDGLAVALARTAAESVLHRQGTTTDPDFLATLAEALVLSGMAMSVAGSSRPCSGACHEIIHAVDALFPGVSNHGELAGIGALFATFLRGDSQRCEQIARCLSQHQLARSPEQVGLTPAEFAKAVHHAPSTRPDRYTILEHLSLDPPRIRRYVDDYFGRYAS